MPEPERVETKTLSIEKSVKDEKEDLEQFEKFLRDPVPKKKPEIYAKNSQAKESTVVEG